MVSKMKKTYKCLRNKCLLIILSTTFCLTGCKSKQIEVTWRFIQKNRWIKTKKAELKCINEQDKEGLKKLASKDAQKHIEDLDGKLDQLIGAGSKIRKRKAWIPAFEVLHRRNTSTHLRNYDLNLVMVRNIYYL